MGKEIFRSKSLVVRSLTMQERPILEKWLNDPFVLKYYEGRDHPFSMDKIMKEFYRDEEGMFRCIVEYHDHPIGYIQYYLVDEPTKKLYHITDNSKAIYGMDQFIGEAHYQNKGIGTALVQAMSAYLIEEMQAELIVMDPQQWNKRALRCYEKSGFVIVKPLLKHEWHEGEYRDCWLMEYRGKGSL
ncbi:GNAT family N-acetyltransferase [Alteribacillus sp. HJP-4]|uniref:GNAT family N-acetyltransferase n=1 Tax=Alteribacillus sp. HJP-4 TaxID=2775394 RepID=UPI0035CCF827